MKKLFSILLVSILLLTGCDKKDVEETPTTYTAYTIGQQVTLKDNSTWYVIEDSDSSSDTVTLFASQNIKNDASGWTTVQSEYAIAFDEANARTTENNSYCTTPANGCNIYAAQSGTVTNGDISGTVTENSTIKKFIDESVKTYINNSLTTSGGTAIESIRLLRKDEYNTIKSNSWSYSTYYWTMTPMASSSNRVNNVNIGGEWGYSDANEGDLGHCDADEGSYYGARPVIVTSKSNIK